MKRVLLTTAMGAALSLVAIAWTTPALAEDCKYHTMRGSVSEMEKPLPGYGFCYLGIVRGTLNGQFISCSYWGDFFASDDLWGDGPGNYWIGKAYDFLETSKGEIFFEERATYDIVRRLASGQLEVTGGTGSYEGATGLMQYVNKWPNRPDLFSSIRARSALRRGRLPPRASPSTPPGASIPLVVMGNKAISLATVLQAPIPAWSRSCSGRGYSTAPRCNCLSLLGLLTDLEGEIGRDGEI